MLIIAFHVILYLVTDKVMINLPNFRMPSLEVLLVLAYKLSSMGGWYLMFLKLHTHMFIISHMDCLSSQIFNACGFKKDTTSSVVYTLEFVDLELMTHTHLKEPPFVLLIIILKKDKLLGSLAI